MASKRVLVSGGRYFNLTDAVHQFLSAIHGKHGISELGEGGATGADELSKLWACAHNIPVRTFEANWKLFGNRAGIMRNASMLRDFRPDVGVVFPGGTGTRDMAARMRGAGVPFFQGSFVAGSDETQIAWTFNNG